MALTVRDGSGFVTAVLVASVAIAVTLPACALPPPSPAVPGPTRLEREGTATVEVGWRNEADEDYVVTLAEDGRMVGYAEVYRCGSHNVIMEMTRPWEIGLGVLDDEPVEGPGQTVFDSSRLDLGDDSRLQMTIHADGTVSMEPLVGEAPVEPGGDC